MTGNRTLTMIKPLTVQNGHIGSILDRIQKEDFEIVAMKMVHLCKREAEAFYAVHKDRPFFESLTDYMSSGPILAAILRKTNAVAEFRTLIGATDPAKAIPGTLRNLYGTDLTRNAIHGSDCDENAEIECRFFFSRLEEMTFSENR